ncbi:MAG TPA: glutathione binding-like protein [Xanthobacteraceae bacterium]
MTTPQAVQAPPALLTFAPMIDSETCRLVLGHYAIPYREEPHLFGWVSILALWHGWTLRVPVLYGTGLRLAGPRSMVDHFDEVCPVERKLVPARQPLHGQVEADWDLYNGELGAHTAVLAYFHLLPHRDIMIEPFFRGVPRTEAFVLGRSYPMLSAMLTFLLQLSAGNAQDALTEIRMIFEKTDARVADGRRYLAGDTLTLADVGLAAAAAPLLLPAGYRSPIPPFERMPPELQAIVTEMRQHDTARFAQRIYAELGAAS